MKKTAWEMPPDVAAIHREIEEWRTNRTKHYCPKQRETILTGRAVADFPVV